MRRARHSRASGREEVVDELFGTRGLEAEPIAPGPDEHFPLRPFAGSIARSDRLPEGADADAPEPERRFRRASEAARKGQRHEAILQYQELLALEPAHVPAHVNLSQLLEERGDSDAALAQLNEALRRRPEDPLLLLTRGALQGRLKRYAEAEHDLRRALHARPNDVEAHFTLGLVLWRKGLPLEAAAALRRAVELGPAEPLAHYYLGEALHQANDIAGARAALERAAELDPGDPRPLQLLGRILDRLKRPEEARAMYQRARKARRQ